MESRISFLRLLRPRLVVLLFLWVAPVLLYLGIGLVALYQTGWLQMVAWVLPIMWLAAWGIGKSWSRPQTRSSSDGSPLVAADFWTPRDAAAIQIVETFRGQVANIDRLTIMDPNRYLRDAQALADQLAVHYYVDDSETAIHPLTLVEILAVIHLAVEDLEQWVLKNVPGSDRATIRHLQRLPAAAKALDLGQTLVFLATTMANPSRLLTYPLWRKAGRVTLELQIELVGAFYQNYLRQVGYYLIEMYSGRLNGGSRQYRGRFDRAAAALHLSGGDASLLAQLDDVPTTIAVMGQVKAGKSSLINALMKDKVAVTSLLPQTREVKRFDYPLPDSDNSVSLLDTPGYGEADVTKRQRTEIRIAAEAADIILLVMAANVSARQTDLEVVLELANHYRERSHLKPPTIIAVLTHIDKLRPLREWSPPYDWRNPKVPKEVSMAKAVEYAKQLFGDCVAGYACVYTGEMYAGDSTVAENLVPQLVEHLDHGHAAAILKAFYEHLSRHRFRQLTRQCAGLLKSVGQSVIR